MERIEDVQVEETKHRDHEVQAIVNEDAILDEEQDIEHVVLEFGVTISKEQSTLLFTLKLRSLWSFRHKYIVSHFNRHLC